MTFGTHRFKRTFGGFRAKPLPRLPRIGPCKDPLRLWFLEYRALPSEPQPGGVFRTYHPGREEARVALRDRKQLERGQR